MERSCYAVYFLGGQALAGDRAGVRRRSTAAFPIRVIRDICGRFTGWLRLGAAVALLCCVRSVFGHEALTLPQETKPLLDKTLVAWVAVSNLTERGGGVVTLMDKAEHFDAIVLGEVATGKWMAGSDFFWRTHQDQAAWPLERAESNEVVQVAISYHGDRVTLFRNGAEYAAHSIGKGQAFGDDTVVLLGLRYLGEMGEIGFFTGAIEEARVYDTALSTGQIAALAPGKVSDPKPLGWWTFEEGRAEDRMKNFPATRLEGSARIAGGKLLLDGSGYLIAARNAKFLATEVSEDTPFDASVQTLFYKARSPRTGNMWDTWLYLHDGTYFLYYLAKSRNQWDNISMARSPDGAHWTEIGRVLSKGRGVTWLGTGSTWKSPNFEKDGKFFINFSEWKGPRQTIFFAESNDLVHWTRLGNEHEFVQDERWYERNGRWDCIWTTPRPGGGLYGYWTATPKAETGGRFGFGESLDGVTWKALAPPKVSGAGEGEVGAIEKVGNKYYMMFGTGGLMVTLVAERPEGPFVAAKKNLRLLAGHTYFARFFPTPEGVLVNHHSIARDGEVYFGTLKATQLDDEGTLRLGWWKGNEKLKQQSIEAKPPSARAGEPPPIALLESEFDARRGLILEGTIKLPAFPQAPPVGLYLAHDKFSGTAIRVHAGGIAEFGSMRADGTGFKAESRVDREWKFGATARFRLLLKGSLLEFYLDDLLIQCHSLPQQATGRVGLLQGGDPAAVTALRAWSASPSKNFQVQPLPGHPDFVFSIYGAPGELEPLKQLVQVMRDQSLGNGFDPGPTPHPHAKPIFDYLAGVGWPVMCYPGCADMQIKGGRCVLGAEDEAALAAMDRAHVFTAVQLGEWGYYFHNLSPNEAWWRDVYGKEFDKFKHLMKPPGLAGYARRPTSRRECYEVVQDYFRSRSRDLLGRVISVTGHSHYEAYAGEWGACCIGLEVAENIAFTQSKFAFARGASRQWQRPWSVQVSPWFSGACTTSGPLRQEAGGARGLDAGHSLSLYERLWLHGWFAGAALVTPENSIAIFFEKAAAPWTLTVHGRKASEVFQFMRAHDRGVPFTPVAIVLDHLAGYNGYMDKPWGILEPTDGDRQVRDLFDHQLFPGSDHIHHRPDPANPESSYLRPTPYGEIFDVQLTSASREMLASYPVILLAGDIEFDDDLLEGLLLIRRNAIVAAILEISD